MKKSKINNVKVEIVEYESGWGQRIEDEEYFPSIEDAAAFIEKYNSKNTSKTVPDTYWASRLA